MRIKNLIISAVMMTVSSMAMAAPASLFIADPDMYSPEMRSLEPSHPNGPEQELQQVNIYVKDNTICVSGANGQIAKIYSITGVLVKEVRIDGHDKHLDLSLQRGYYMVQVGKIVRKVYIQ